MKVWNKGMCIVVKCKALYTKNYAFNAYFCWNNTFLTGLSAKIRLHGLLLGKADNISNPQSSHVGVFLRKVLRRIRSKVRVNNCALKRFVFQTVFVKTSRLITTDERLTAKAKVQSCTAYVSVIKMFGLRKSHCLDIWLYIIFCISCAAWYPNQSHQLTQ